MSLADVLSQVSRVLQCEICAAAFQCAMMLPCGHVFCSACIRRALTYQELCPACKQPHTASQLTPVRRLDAVRDLLHNLGALVSSALATASATAAAAASATASNKPKKLRSRQLKSADDDDNDDEAYNDDDEHDDDAEQHSSRRSSRQAAVDVASDDDFRQLPKSGSSRSVSASKKRRVAAVPSRKVPELRTVVDWMAPVEQRANVPRNPHFKSLSLPSLKTRMQQFNLSTVGKRETMEARLREFVLRCQINADSIEPLSMAQIAREVNEIDFTSARSAALSRSSSAFAAANDDDLEEVIVVSMLQQQEEQQRQQQEQTADAAPTGQRAATQSQAQSQAATESQTQAVPQPPPPQREPAVPTLLQRVSQIARSVDFGEWRVVWSNKYQCPFYFCPRTGTGTFEKPAAIAVDIYEQAQQAQRASEHAT
jgi:hypothetical protein